MLAPLKLPRLPANQKLINTDGTATTTFSIWWQNMAQQIETAINGVQAALDAADFANIAAENAQMAADNANAAAASNALASSYISPSPALSATPTNITIVNHTRFYGDGTSVAVNGATIPASSPGNTDYVSYSDPNRLGGNVMYVTSPNQPTQINGVHVVGAVTIPNSGTQTGGNGPRQPGEVEP